MNRDKAWLETLVERYGNLKGEMDSYKKQVDADNKDIKDLMSSLGVDKFESENYTAKYSVAVSENFDEDKLVSKLQVLGIEGLIVMKPTVDMTALENAIYNGKVDAADLADCKVRKETPRLNIYKKKKE
jgi:hypothetical protein